MFDELTAIAIVNGNGMSDLTTELTDNSTACLLGRLPGVSFVNATSPLSRSSTVLMACLCEDNTILPSHPLEPSRLLLLVSRG